MRNKELAGLRKRLLALPPNLLDRLGWGVVRVAIDEIGPDMPVDTADWVSSMLRDKAPTIEDVGCAEELHCIADAIYNLYYSRYGSRYM